MSMKCAYKPFVLFGFYLKSITYSIITWCSERAQLKLCKSNNCRGSSVNLVRYLLVPALCIYLLPVQAQVTGTPVNNPPQVAMSVDDLALLPDLLAILDGHPIVTYFDLVVSDGVANRGDGQRVIHHSHCQTNSENNRLGLLVRANCATDFRTIYLDYNYITGNGQGRNYLIALGCIIHELGHIEDPRRSEEEVVAWTREQLIRLRDERLKPPPVDVPSVLLPIYNVLLLGEL